MAASGYTPISLYYSSTAAATPVAGNLVNGELAINITDGKLFYKDNLGAVKVIAGTGGTGVVAGSNTQVQYNNNGVFGASSNLTFNGTTLTANTLSLTNALAATSGGTGFASYAVGDLLYASTTTALSKLADVATGNALISGGVGVAPSWGKIGLTTHVSGTLPIANGGTNSTATPTNGGISYGTGTAFAFSAAGTSGQILTSAGAAAPTWSTLSGVAVTTFSAGTTGLTPSTATSGAITLAGTLIAANGGTGFASYAVGDILYASSTTALSKLADVATGNALISGGVGVAPSYGKIGLTTHVSGTLPIANGGTNSTATPTNGGVAYGTGTAFAFGAAGTSGQILRSNGAAAPTWVDLSTLGVSTISFGTTGLTPATATSGAVTVAGTLAIANGGTGATVANGALTNLRGYTTTATAAGTTTLTSSSTYRQYFTGTTTQTVVMPVVTTLALGWSYEIVNNSTGTITVNSSGGNLINTIPAGLSGVVTCIAITGTTAASWHFEYASFDTITGTGACVFSASPTLTGTLTVATLTASADSSFTSTGALLISKGTTAQQPGTPVTGMIRYNTTSNEFEGYSGGTPSWKSIGGSAIVNDTTTASARYPLFSAATSGTAQTVYTSNAKYLYTPSTGSLEAPQVEASNGFFVNPQTISTSYTLAATDNAGSFGPISVASGVTVTVSSGATWTVV